MHIDFELSERDYVHAQSQVVMPGIQGVKVRIQVLILPFVGCAFIGRSFFSGTTRLGPFLVNMELLLVGVGCVVVPLGLYFWVCGRLSRIAKVIYRSAPSLQGRLFLDMKENGIELAGEDFFWKASWTEFTKFFEDRRVFILYQRHQQEEAPPIAFHVVTKRTLSHDQIKELRQYLQRNIGLAKRTQNTACLRRHRRANFIEQIVQQLPLYNSSK